MIALGAEVQGLPTRVTELAAKRQAPVTDARHCSVPPAPTRQAHIPPRPPQGTRRAASVGRAGGGRPLPPTPDPVLIAQATVCPHGGHGVVAEGQALPAVDDTSEVPPVNPSGTRVEPYGGGGAGCGQPSVAPVPTGMEPGPPVGAAVQRLATDLRSTHASSDERLSALVAPGCGLDIRAGGLAHLVPGVKGRRDPRVAAIRTRLRRRRLMGRDATSARVNGPQPWAWGLQPSAVGRHVSRPSRGQGVSQEVLGAPRPTSWGSARSSAPPHHPAEAWPVCWAHQVRAGPVALDAGDPRWAPRMQAVCRRAVAIHQRRETRAASTR
jgi:transposase